jgi:chaperonin cofactor prefoldin
VSLPYHKIDWDLVREVRTLQGQMRETQKQLQELQRLVSRTLAQEDP